MGKEKAIRIGIFAIESSLFLSLSKEREPAIQTLHSNVPIADLLCYCSYVQTLLFMYAGNELSFSQCIPRFWSIDMPKSEICPNVLTFGINPDRKLLQFISQ